MQIIQLKYYKKIFTANRPTQVVPVRLLWPTVFKCSLFFSAYYARDAMSCVTLCNLFRNTQFMQISTKVYLAHYDRQTVMSCHISYKII